MERVSIFTVQHTITKPHLHVLNFLSNDKLFHLSNLKAFGDDKINMTQKLKFDLGKIENIVGNGENAGYHHFLLLPQCFQQASSLGSLKLRIVW